MPLVSLVNLEERLGIEAGSSPPDAGFEYLSSLLDRASAMVENVIGREVEQAAFTEYVNGRGTPYLNLRRGPIDVAVTPPVVSSVTYDSDRVESLTTVAAGDYQVWGIDANWRLPGYLEAASWAWSTGNKNYKIVYTAGWATVPADIQEATLHTAVWMKNKRRDTATSDRSVGDASMGGFANLTDLVAELREMLAPYIPRHF